MDRINIVVPLFEGVTTAIVAFCFVCVIFPHIVKNKTQFYAGFAAILLVILLHSLAIMLHTSAGFRVFAGAATCLLQIVAVVTLFLSAGGITLKELGSDMARAYEVIRRGETEKTVIVPLSGEPAKRPAASSPPASPEAGVDEAPGEHRIDLPEGAGWQRKPANPPEETRIPLE